ncbi:MAG: hypothetical protein EOM26_13690 [Alphaproteobacteria bacterium]|nr:hypothetical protein [Alphaproteobacteria bacterium]
MSERTVHTKGKTYRLAPDQTGEPAEAVFGDEAVKRLGLEGATIYTMPDGRRVVAMPGPAEG